MQKRLPEKIGRSFRASKKLFRFCRDNKKQVGETKARVKFVPLAIEHLERARQWLYDADVIRFLPSLSVLEQIADGRFLQEEGDPDFGDHYAILDENGEHIGFGGFEWIDVQNRVVEGYLVIGDKSKWRKGYATEVLRIRLYRAFELCGVHRIEATCLEENAAMLYILEREGFAREGKKRKRFFRGGNWHDAIIFAMLEEEYFQRRR